MAKLIGEDWLDSSVLSFRRECSDEDASSGYILVCALVWIVWCAEDLLVGGTKFWFLDDCFSEAWDDDRDDVEAAFKKREEEAEREGGCGMR